MRTSLLAIAAIALSASLVTFTKADAMPFDGIGQAADHLNAVEQTQFFYGGQNYCFYLDGWRGPGWYRCGYHLRRGFGWGGPQGWRGWRHGPVPRVHRGPGPRLHLDRGPANRVHRGGPRRGGPGGGKGNR